MQVVRKERDNKMATHKRKKRWEKTDIRKEVIFLAV